MKLGSVLPARRPMVLFGILAVISLLIPQAANAQTPSAQNPGGADGLWDPSPEIQSIINEADPGEILVFVTSEEDAPSLIGTADQIPEFDAKQFEPPPASLPPWDVS